MDIFEHKGYFGMPQIEADDNVIAGTLIGLRAVVTFEGTTVQEAKQAFVDSVEDYLKWCEQRGVAAEKPFTGPLEIAMPSPSMKSLAIAAAQRGISAAELSRIILESWVSSGRVAVATTSPELRGL